VHGRGCDVGAHLLLLPNVLRDATVWTLAVEVICRELGVPPAAPAPRVAKSPGRVRG